MIDRNDYDERYWELNLWEFERRCCLPVDRTLITRNLFIIRPPSKSDPADIENTNLAPSASPIQRCFNLIVRLGLQMGVTNFEEKYRDKDRSKKNDKTNDVWFKSRPQSQSVTLIKTIASEANNQTENKVSIELLSKLHNRTSKTAANKTYAHWVTARIWMRNYLYDLVGHEDELCTKANSIIEYLFRPLPKKEPSSREILFSQRPYFYSEPCRKNLISTDDSHYEVLDWANQLRDKQNSIPDQNAQARFFVASGGLDFAQVEIQEEQGSDKESAAITSTEASNQYILSNHGDATLAFAVAGGHVILIHPYLGTCDNDQSKARITSDGFIEAISRIAATNMYPYYVRQFLRPTIVEGQAQSPQDYKSVFEAGIRRIWIVRIDPLQGRTNDEQSGDQAKPQSKVQIPTKPSQCSDWAGAFLNPVQRWALFTLHSNDNLLHRKCFISRAVEEEPFAYATSSNEQDAFDKWCGNFVPSELVHNGDTIINVGQHCHQVCDME